MEDTTRSSSLVRAIGIALTALAVYSASVQEAAEAAAALAAARDGKEGFSADAAALFASMLGHSAEHYGQLVVYARLSGVVPPASR